MEETGNSEDWNDFLKKQVNVIVEDKPSPYPKTKSGLFDKSNSTHIIIIKDNKEPEAIRRVDIRRVELRK